MNRIHTLISAVIITGALALPAVASADTQTWTPDPTPVVPTQGAIEPIGNGTCASADFDLRVRNVDCVRAARVARIAVRRSLPVTIRDGRKRWTLRGAITDLHTGVTTATYRLGGRRVSFTTH